MPKVSRRVGGKLLTAEERAQPDHGADGPAQLVRPAEVKEWKVTGTTAKRILPSEHPETNPLDHYERGALLTERQIFAGRRLQLNYARGYGRQRLVARLLGGGGTLSDDRALTQSQCRAVYNEAMNTVPHSARPTMEDIARGDWPKQVDKLIYLRIGIDAIADHWGFARTMTGTEENN